MLFSVLAVGLLVQQALGATYRQTETIEGAGFFNSFSHEAISDPTHGRVNYVNGGVANDQNLTYAWDDHFVLRADSETRLNPNGPGRASVRLLSNRKYGANTVLVFNIRHMPVGCGTWPAVWTVGSNWPNLGEIDILEGVNDNGPNAVTLHTSPGCTMPWQREQTGISAQNNCDVYATGNAGCGVKMNEGSTYAHGFNEAGGGWYALERTNSFIKVWFWGRQSERIPAEVRNGSTRVNTDKWGTPNAYFPDTSCDISSKFGPHNIVINLTFCGDWAGAVYGSSGCPSNCIDYVNNNPAAFRDAYFDFQWIKTYGL